MCGMVWWRMPSPESATSRVTCPSSRTAERTIVVHTPSGTSIVVSAVREDGHVTLEVADSGLGIRHQTMPHIFEPFYTSADGSRGAGLGLAIARELAERMSGELSVRSAPGSTTFKLTLPV